MQPQYITLPKHAKDLAGQQFGRLTALGPIGKTPARKTLWLCRCQCQNEVSVASGDLISGKAQSCGCLRRERTSEANTTHGMSETSTYSIWLNMIRRCTDPNNLAYKDYGGRGIKVCDEWRYSFAVFHEHVSQLAHYGEEGYTLDRVDNLTSAGYSPGNVRWATRKEQANNRRTRQDAIAFGGKTQSLAAWARELNVEAGMLHERLHRGWSIDRTLTTPKHGNYANSASATNCP